jgi:hypothetical protein
MNKNEIINLEGFTLDEIESIELVGEEDTIDITVDNTHMFFANDIYTHNSSIGADTVDSTMIGGSIKKGQIGHFIVSIAKDLDQKETGRANMAILKSRFGVDGIIFSDIEFDNARIQISIDNGNVMKASEMDDYKQAKGTERVGDLLTQFDNDKKAKLKAELIDLENKK